MVLASRGHILAMVLAACTMARAPGGGGLEKFLTAPCVANLGIAPATEDSSRLRPRDSKKVGVAQMCPEIGDVCGCKVT